MVDALRDRWRAVFERKQVDEAKVKQCIASHMPLFPTVDVGAPAKAQIRGFLQRAAPSAPGPDLLPHRAWLA
eukprot:6329615-Pyramimonas_sp.AAC.1